MAKLKLHPTVKSEPERLGVRMAADKTLELLIYDVIGETWDGEGVTAKAVAKALKDNSDVTTIMVRINSPGGSVFDATAIYNRLHQHKAEVIVEIDGMALSAASVVAMAGDTIRMAENALLMIHDPIAWAIGPAEEMRKTAEMLDKIKDTIVTTYAARSGMTARKVGELMEATTWLNAEEAQELGLADEIVEAKKAAACGRAGVAIMCRNLRASAPTWARRRLDAQERAELSAVASAAESEEVAMSGTKNEKAPAEAVPASPPAIAAGSTVAADASRISALREALPQAGNDFYVECLENQRTVEQARAAWIVKLQGDLQTIRAEHDKIVAENKQLNAKVFDFEAAKRGGPGPGDGQAVDKAPEQPGGPPPDTEAGWEQAWNKNTDGVQQTFGGKDEYLAYCRAKADGRVTVLERPDPQ